MFSGITITCFAASYAVTLALELSRLMFRANVRFGLIVFCTLAGLLAHSLHLINQVQQESATRGVTPFGSWYDFCLLAALVLAGAYLGLNIRRPENAVGIFLLPLVLGLIGIAVLFRGAAPFSPTEALSVWRIVHGLALLLGTSAVTLGFATGLMYLLQSYRLKHKLLPRQGFRLPSLEWLQRFNREALLISTALLAMGLLSGVALNLISSAEEGLPVQWTDPVVLSSGVLFVWLVVIVAFESLYKPARQGQKIAYLTLASFIFLGLALSFVLFGEHASSAMESPRPPVLAAADEGIASAAAVRTGV